MESARAAIDKIIGRTGHETEVNEVVNPAVTQETVKPTRHEETTTAVDKEVHQDHFHTTVQPLAHREVLPEKHEHQTMPVQERTFHHGDDNQIRQTVGQEAAQFQSTSTTAPTLQSRSEAATATGEHVHHHVHETVQPVIHKETIAPEVVHTTIPVYEKHHAPSEHHGMSQLPVKSLDEFKSAGGELTGTSHRHEHYEGDPRHYNSNFQVERHDVDIHPDKHDGLHSEDQSGSKSGIATAGAAALGSSHHSHGTSTGLTGSSATGTTGVTGSSTGYTGSGTTAGLTGQSSTGHIGSGTTTGLTGQSSTGHHTGGNIAGRATDIAAHSSQGPTEAHNTTTSSQGLGNTTGTFESAPSTTRGYDSTQHDSGHGITNQIHHGTERDNVSRDDSVQHGSQSRDPAIVDTGSDKKLTGTGADGSHSAVFGLTPDGHKHKETSSQTTPLKPAHSENSSNTDSKDLGSRAVGSGAIAEQMHDPRVAEKSHGGAAVSSTGSTKPGAGAPGGEQGFGQIRSQEHGATSKMQDKLDPHTDADGDGKKGIMD